MSAKHEKADTILSLQEVVVTSTGITPVKRSAFNAVSVDTKGLLNSSKSLSDALAKIPGMKLRETGGLGSETQVMMDGFTGKHVKVFIDGAPQEGVGNSLGLNNIPINFAKRIEVYKGVVPVGFGTDAIGGIINIITNKEKRNWFIDASYSYGSFNTHRSYINFGQTFKNGLIYEINAFQNYSDNNFHIDAPVEDFTTGSIDRNTLHKVKRFNDTFHNEAIIGKIGFTGKPWADRLMIGFTASSMYKEIQTGVRQEIVYGEKHRKGYSLIPSLEYRKQNLFTRGLNVHATANYNKNLTTNVDTASCKYNWHGETKPLNSPGEQAYQHSQASNDNWNGSLKLDYRFDRIHLFTFNNVFNAFRRSNSSLLTSAKNNDAIAKQTHKNIFGLSYRLMPSSKWNFSVFGKLYNLYVAGPIATTTNQDAYVRTSRSLNSIGYGFAGTYFIIDGLQAKASYEKAFRLPTIEEMFGDEDLEIGDIGIKPENSHNVNININYGIQIGNHSFYVEGGVILRDTHDYIQRNITDLSGGKYAARYINYGKVLTKGYNVSLRYNLSNWMSLGINLTKMDVRDNMKSAIGSNAPNIAYKEQMPNIPYLFADSDINFHCHNLLKKGNTLTISYDNQYLHSFNYYSSLIGTNKSDYAIPSQFSHNASLSYTIDNGKYNVSIECRNLTNENLYDNFSLQKADRAFYAKVRLYLSN